MPNLACRMRTTQTHLDRHSTLHNPCMYPTVLVLRFFCVHSLIPFHHHIKTRLFHSTHPRGITRMMISSTSGRTGSRKRRHHSSVRTAPALVVVAAAAAAVAVSTLCMSNNVVIPVIDAFRIQHQKSNRHKWNPTSTTTSTATTTGTRSPPSSSPSLLFMAQPPRVDKGFNLLEIATKVVPQGRIVQTTKESWKFIWKVMF